MKMKSLLKEPIPSLFKPINKSKLKAKEKDNKRIILLFRVVRLCSLLQQIPYKHHRSYVHCSYDNNSENKAKTSTTSTKAYQKQTEDHSEVETYQWTNSVQTHRIKQSITNPNNMKSDKDKEQK